MVFYQTLAIYFTYSNLPVVRKLQEKLFPSQEVFKQIFLFTDTGLYVNIFEWTIFHTPTNLYKKKSRTIVWCQRENIMWNRRNISAVLWWNQREFQVYANSNFFAKINPYKRLTKYRSYFCYVVEIVHVEEYA